MSRQLAQRQLLTLLGEPPVTLSELSEQDWTTLISVASRHRLLPLLHWQLSHIDAKASIPPFVLERLSNAYRNATCRASNRARHFGRSLNCWRRPALTAWHSRGRIWLFTPTPRRACAPCVT